jgi:hypothetical protein
MMMIREWQQRYREKRSSTVSKTYAYIEATVKAGKTRADTSTREAGSSRKAEPEKRKRLASAKCMC